MTLESELAALGVEVSTDRDLRLKVSSDWSRMSPVLQDKLPPGRYLADLVVRPTSPDQVPAVLAVAYRHDVPVTPRGAGTGNYGQATPFDGGIVLDLRGLDHVEVTGETVRAGAGAKLTTVDEVARAAGRDIWIFPSTKGSTVGGFVGGGSAGTGTVEHRTTSDGYVVSATVAPMDGSGSLFTVSGKDLEPYVHTYGVTGVLVDVEIRTDPAREWVAVYGSFGSYADLVAVHRTLADLPVRPRLASGDEPALVPTLPVALDPERWSLRVIAEASTVDEVVDRIRGGCGEVVRVARDYAETDVVSGMSYNHPVYFLQQSLPADAPRLFHVESSGEPLWDSPDAVRACYSGPVHLHLELFQHGPGAMIVAEYSGEEELLAGIRRLESIGVGVHSPHQWYVDRNVELARETARRTDPKGLLNPGKLVSSPPVDSRVNIGVVR
ncbi:FAD-binding oxidoreductase [Pseudonocardia pini]|uniref:FAD-binding oxidoreductase n=1 Tax=Pseudonocardia pini TaxID=2758030 RepID=UPI0028AFCE4C|nr:FAD-binding oxidoreductase [Pseudonocardia pini]